MNPNDSDGKNLIDLLYLTHYTPLVLWADTLLHDMTQSEDVVQDFFVRLWEKGIYLTLKEETLKAYLYTSVRNAALRRKNSQSKKFLLAENFPADKVWENETQTHEEIIQCLQDAIDRLPQRSREVLKCVHLENMGYQETADLLGISVATVKTHLIRSIKKLRESVNKPVFIFIRFKDLFTYE